jgi:hypothetical protein
MLFIFCDGVIFILIAGEECYNSIVMKGEPLYTEGELALPYIERCRYLRAVIAGACALWV